MVCALQSGSNIIPLVSPGFKWPRPDTVPESLRQICYMSGIRWKWGSQSEVSDRLEKFMVGTGSLQSLTSIRRTASKSTVASSRNGDSLVPPPLTGDEEQQRIPMSRTSSQRSITSVTSRASNRSYQEHVQNNTRVRLV